MRSLEIRKYGNLLIGCHYYTCMDQLHKNIQRSIMPPSGDVSYYLVCMDNCPFSLRFPLFGDPGTHVEEVGEGLRLLLFGNPGTDKKGWGDDD